MIDVPSPPQWLTELSIDFLEHIAEPMYWLLLVAGFLAYMVLRWQRRPSESTAARALRVRELGKCALWLALALGRVAGEWMLILWSLAVLIALLVTLFWLLSLYRTYVRPAWKKRRTAVYG